MPIGTSQTTWFPELLTIIQPASIQVLETAFAASVGFVQAKTISVRPDGGTANRSAATAAAGWIAAIATTVAHTNPLICHPKLHVDTASDINRLGRGQRHIGVLLGYAVVAGSADAGLLDDPGRSYTLIS